MAIAKAERLAGRPLAEQLTDPVTGCLRRIKLVTDNGGAFKGTRFAAFIASRPELVCIRTRRRPPSRNGVRERAFGSLKHQRLYRVEIPDGQALAVEAEACRQIFNTIRPREALGMRRRSRFTNKINGHNFPPSKTEPGS